MFDDSGAARYLRETHALAEALNAATTPRSAPADPRTQLRRCLRTYLDCMLETRNGFLYLPGGKPRVLSGDVTAEFTLHEMRRTITERFLVCASGSDRRGPLGPLVKGWLALAESMYRDWVESGIPGRDELEDLLCDLFFAAVEVAHQHPR